MVMNLQEYEIKKKIRKEMTVGKIAEEMRGEFGMAEEKNGHVQASFGALRRIECWLGEKGQLCVETESNKEVSDETASDTIGKFNRFLVKVTGYTSKERRKNAMKNK